MQTVLHQNFQEKESEPRGHQYSYFEAIFCGREGEPLLHETRISLLINLCSLAVQYPCYSVLNHISQWLHKVVLLNLFIRGILTYFLYRTAKKNIFQIGSGKSYAQQFVSQLVDHYIFIPDDSNLVRHFSAIFLVNHFLFSMSFFGIPRQVGFF